ALVAACLERISERDDAVRAWAHIDAGGALAQARERDAAAAPLGPLHGVPVGVKDIVDTADLPTECGTPIYEGRRPGRDAACVARLRAAGAVVIGKTVTTELAYFQPGKTRNPAAPDRTPGGSSSGRASRRSAGRSTRSDGSRATPRTSTCSASCSPTAGPRRRTIPTARPRSRSPA